MRPRRGIPDCCSRPCDRQQLRETPAGLPFLPLHQQRHRGLLLSARRGGALRAASRGLAGDGCGETVGSVTDRNFSDRSGDADSGYRAWERTFGGSGCGADLQFGCRSVAGLVPEKSGIAQTWARAPLPSCLPLYTALSASAENSERLFGDCALFSMICGSRYSCDLQLIIESRAVPFASANALFAGANTVFVGATGLCNWCAGSWLASVNTLLALANTGFARVNALFAYVNTLFASVSAGAATSWSSRLSSVGTGFGIVFLSE